MQNFDVDILEVEKELFKRRNFDFITIRPDSSGKLKKHAKQEEALMFLTDKETEEFLYGGGAGGAKSWTGCTWLAFECLNNPSSRWFIGREELKRITESTLITFFKVALAYNIRNYRYNAQKNFIQFDNGSRIDLLELKRVPRDPLFERFGSTEYSGGWIEEAGEVDFAAYDVLRTRIGRHYNEKYGLTGKIFVTCNPKKNWLYGEFYKPYTLKKLETGLKRFLPAFVFDNPFIDKGYIERLKRTKDKSKKERLLKGNWDYDDNPYTLCEYDNITAVFTNDHVNKNDKGEKKTGLKKYLTADIARFGSDKARIGVWEEWELIEVKTFDISKTTEIQACINTLRAKHQISKLNCVADDDGVGGGVVDNCGIRGFVNNATPLKELVNMKLEVPKYKNLQTQCLFGLAEKINTAQIYISAELSEADRELIIEELGTIEQNPDVTEKLALTTKAEIKENIGRSPDFRDMLLMRKYFDYKKGGFRIA